MIEYTTGDILKSGDNVDAIVNTVNCVGVMGRGIALQFKKAYPENFEAYAKACKKNKVRTGQVFVYETGQLTNPRYIINFPTKRHWRGDSRMEDIEAGLKDLVETIRKHKIHSVAIPPLGCGLGGLKWSEVQSRIAGALEELTDVRAIVFEPGDAPDAEEMTHTAEKPNMTKARASLIALMERYLRGFLDPTVSLLEAHKLMYFMQEAGEPLRLKYQKASYGPYAKNLRHLMNEIEGHFVIGYADGEDAPEPIDLKPDAAKLAEAFLEKHPQTRKRLDKVVQLVEGFESPFGLELLATAHWVVKRENKYSENDIAATIYAWSRRKQQFTKRQIGIAVDRLQKQGWVGGITA